MPLVQRRWRPSSQQRRLQVVLILGCRRTLEVSEMLMYLTCCAVEAPVCIVTGGARGIGRAIAEMLGATGAKVKFKLLLLVPASH